MARKSRTEPALQPQLIAVPDARVDAEAAAQSLRDLAQRANTAAAYAVAWDSFRAFCDAKTRRYKALPASPRAVSEYLAYLHKSGKALRTIKQHKAAIRRYHRMAGHVDPSKDPLVEQTWTGIYISFDQDVAKPTLAAMQAALTQIVDAIDKELADAGAFAPPNIRLQCARDRALLLLTHSSAHLTTRELQSMDFDEIAAADGGIVARVRRSPDAVAKPREAFIRFGHAPRYCPVRALQEWKRVSELEHGPIFRKIDRYGHLWNSAMTPQNIRLVVARRCALAGFTSTLLSVRSFRAGSMLQAAYDGQSDEQIIQDAGLSEESTPLLRPGFERARSLKKKKIKPPKTMPLA